MKNKTITFVSNFINHHQKPLADAMFAEVGDSYHFIQTMPMDEERVAMGWALDVKQIPYVKLLYDEPEVCEDLIMNSDIVIFGWTGREDLVEKRLQTKKATIRVSERLYREGQWKAISPRGLIAKYKEHIKYRNQSVCMLCAGAYTASDFHLIHAYPNKLFKWGYFPPLRTYEDGVLEAKKDSDIINIVWAGRFISLKHPEYVLRLAQKLKETAGLKFHIHMVGSGELEDELKDQTKNLGLEECITFYGFLNPEQVRDLMEKCHIHLFTSNYLEGWGAVVNEAMNSGCVEICNAQVGAGPFLIEDGVNGFLYPNGSYNEMEQIVLRVVKNWEQYVPIGKKAYETIKNGWNAEHAAKELIRFGNDLLNGEIRPAKEGPLSVAPILKAPMEGTLKHARL